MRSIESLNGPLAFKVRDGAALYDWPTSKPGEIAVRVAAGALAGMQKQGLVYDGVSGTLWHMLCDEGPYLNGTDLAPFPLAFFTTGLILSYFGELEALAKRRGVALRNLELVQDNRYTMEGSALRGTMLGGALPVSLGLEAGGDADRGTLLDLVAGAVAASPADALLRETFESLFTLTHNGATSDPARVGGLDVPPLPRPDAALEVAREDPDADFATGLIEKLSSAETVFGVEGGAGSSLQAEQKRVLHVRGIARRRADGLIAVRVQLFKPIGSVFRFLGDTCARYGGTDRAPSALAYLSAGIAFCFMTQLGRFAQIMKQRLDHYSIVQDTRFGEPSASAGLSRPAWARTVETHAHIDSPEDRETVRHLLDMGEQTCFLHAACRTALKTRIRGALRPTAEADR